MEIERPAKSSDANAQQDSDPMLKLVNDFLAQAQQGKQPSIDDFCEKNPEQAEEIRELFPALVLMENLQPTSSDSEPHFGDTLDTPDQIGDYRIIGEIGRGGMGVVYEAEQESLNRRVALKVLPHNTHLTGSSRLRFQQEARAAAKMHHTNIVPVFEVGQDGEYTFYAMQLILGQSLDLVIEELKRSGSRIQAEKLSQPASDQGKTSAVSNDSGSAILSNSLSESNNSKRRQFYRSVAKIALQVADALAYAHTRGVIHRDIKPSNLLLDAEGVVWVTDFGLAKIDDINDQGLTQTGDFLGTLRYMSPERFQGKCDIRADIYALGLTMYELVLQQPAFDSSDRLKMIHLINRDNPAKPRAIDPNIPRDLETIILKSIEKEPKERYRNARALEQDLQRFINDEPIKAQRTSLLKQTAYWARRNRGLAAAVVSIAALLLVLLVGSTVTALHQSRLRQTAEDAKSVADKARVEAEASQLLVEQNLYFSQMNLAGKIIGQAAGINEIKTVTDAWLPTSATQDLRGWEWYYLRSYCLENILPLIAPQPNTPLDAVWSPDQTRIATAQSDQNIYIWDSNTGELLHTLEGNTNIVVSVAWNPSQELLAACDDENNIWIWDLQTNQTTQRFKAPEGAFVEQVAWDPTGKQLAWSSNSSTFIWDLEQADEKPIELKDGPGVITSLQWSPDGKHLAGSGWRQRKTVVWNVENQETVKEKFDATLVKWSPGGHQIEGWLLATPTGEIKLFLAKTETPIQRFFGHTAMAKFMAWSSDGKKFLSASADQTVRIWDIESGDQLRIFQGHTANVLTARFNREGTKVVSTSSDKSARIWDAKSPQKKTIRDNIPFATNGTLKDRPEISSLSWHPDGKRLAAVGLNGRYCVWDTTVTELLYQDKDIWVESIHWSEDGKWVAMDELEQADLEEYLGEEYIRLAPGYAILREIGHKEIGAADKIRTVLAPHPQRCNGVAWSPSAERFATICNDKKVRIWSLVSAKTTGKNALQPKLISEFPGHQFRPSDIQWNPRKNNLFAISDAHGVIKIWDEAGERWTLNGHQGMIHQIAWSPDGEHLASAGKDGTVRIWNAQSGQQTNILTGHHNAVFTVAWSPQGSRIATGSQDSAVKIWDPISGAEALSLSDHQGAVLSVAWSRDGMQLATADITGALIIWNAKQAYQEAASGAF